jgi:alkylmercury lyase
MSMTDLSLLDQCARFLKRGYAQSNPPELQRASLAIYRVLATGRPAVRPEIARALGVSPAALTKALSLLPAHSINADDRGRIVAFVGLSLVAAKHALLVGKNRLYTWCAFDALFLPPLLGTDARLVTTCPASGHQITVRITAASARAENARAPVVSMVAPSREDCCRDLRAAFCDHSNLFRDRRAFSDWSGKGREMLALPLDEAFAVALRRNQWRFPDVEWRKP